MIQMNNKNILLTPMYNQQPSVYSPNLEPNVEFPGSQ